MLVYSHVSEQVRTEHNTTVSQLVRSVAVIAHPLLFASSTFCIDGYKGQALENVCGKIIPILDKTS